MTDCCESKSCEVAAMRESHGRVLWIFLAINAAMFGIEGYYGLVARSSALLADSLDMLGDALVYGFSLFVLHRSAQWQARAAFAKGIFMLLFGLAVLGEAAYKMVVPVVPAFETMGVIGALALAANLVCFGLLYRYRGDNLNMSSTWLCSRNDLLPTLGFSPLRGPRLHLRLDGRTLSWESRSRPCFSARHGRSGSRARRSGALRGSRAPRSSCRSRDSRFAPPTGSRRSFCNP